MVQRLNGLRYRGAILIVMFSLATMLAGCDIEKTRNLIDQRAGEAQDTLVKARGAQPTAKRYNPLVVTDKIWEGNAAMRMHRGLPLPARYETPRGITIISGQPLTLIEIADAITSQTGIPVRAAGAGGSRLGSGPSNSSSSNSASGLPSPLPAPVGNSLLAGGPNSAANANAANSSSSTTNDGMLISYEGPLSGLLERVAGYFGVNWRYDGTSVSIVRFETKVFLVEALPNSISTEDKSQGSSTSGSSSSGGGSSGGGGGSSGGSSSGATSQNSSSGTLTQSVSYTGSIKYWDELKEILTSMLAGNGTVVLSPSNGEVTVTTTPEIMQTISTYLGQENKRLSRQIAINVEVYDVDMSRDSDFNASFTAALSRLDNIASIKFAGPSAPASAGALSGLGQLSVAIINPDHQPKVNDIFNALSSVGDTTTVAQFPMITLNNRPVSRFVGTAIDYVPSVTSNTTASTSTTTNTSIQTQTINSGFTVQLTPRLLDDGRILLQYSLNISGTPTFQFFNSCTGTASPSSSSTCPSVQLATVNERTFIQQSVLRSGSTLVIGGVDQENVLQNAQGVGDPFNWLLGGGTSNSTARTMVFIAITPQVLDPPASEQGL